MKAIYLDQNKWIELAKARVGKAVDQGLHTALNAIEHRVRAGEWVLPLSAVHYIEIARIHRPRRRADLGRTMWALSGGVTLAAYSDILGHELEVALAQRFSNVRARPLKLFGRGVAHAFGMPGVSDIRLPGGALEHLSPTERDRVKTRLREAVDESLLTGASPDGGPPPVFTRRNQNRLFMKHLGDLPTTLRQLPRSRWHDALAAMEIVDIREPINDALTAHGLEWTELMALGKEELTRFIADLPTRAIDLHMHWQIAKNPSLKPRETDLEDWGGLIPAAARCDVVVCEKHFADLLRRDGFKPPAEILTDLRELVAA